MAMDEVRNIIEQLSIFRTSPAAKEHNELIGRLLQRLQSEPSLLFDLIRDPTWQILLSYPSHEAYVKEFKIETHLKEGNSLHYSAGIPERHRQDVAFYFKGASAWHHLLLPGAKNWFDNLDQEGVAGIDKQRAK